MPKKLPLEGDSADKLSALLGRFGRLRDEMWGGNLAAMARDLGVRKATLWRLMTDGRVPPATLLLALAARPDVDSRWLLTGEPTTYTPRRIPLASTLLPDSPKSCGRLLTPVFVETEPDPFVAEEESLGEYAYLVRANDPFAAAADLRVFPGDCLFVSADLGAVFRVRHQPGALCVVFLPGEELDPVTQNFGRVRAARVADAAGAIDVFVQRPRRYRPLTPEETNRLRSPALFPPLLPAGEEVSADSRPALVVGVCRKVVRWYDPRLAPWPGGGD